MHACLLASFFPLVQHRAFVHSLSITSHHHQQFIQLILLFYRYNNYNKSTNIYYIFHIMEIHFITNSHSLFTYKCSPSYRHTYTFLYMYMCHYVIWPLMISSCSLYSSTFEIGLSVTRFIYLFSHSQFCILIRTCAHSRAHNSPFVIRISHLVSLCVLIPLLFLLCVLSSLERTTTKTDRYGAKER